MARDVYEMQGTIVAWGDIHGEIMTDDGERIYFSPMTLQLHRIGQAAKVGDRIYFYALRRVDIKYHVQSVRMLVPSEPDHEKLRRLKHLNRAINKERNPDAIWSIMEIEHFTGAIESYDPKTGGIIRCDTGEEVRLDSLCVRTSRFKPPHSGDRISFSAHKMHDQWHALRIEELGNQRKRKVRPARLPKTAPRSRKPSPRR